MSSSDPFGALRDVADGCLSDLQLDRLRLGEVAGAERARLEAHVASCARCAERAQSLGADAESFPQRVFVSGLAASAQRRARRVRLMRWAGPAAAVAAALTVFVYAPRDDEGGLRVKGSDALELFRVRPDGGQEPLEDGAEVHPGDLLRLAVAPAQPSHVLVLGVDSARAVSSYFQGADGTAALPRGYRLLSEAVELDATLGPERLFALFCDSPVAAAAAHLAAEAALEASGGAPADIARLELPCRQASRLIVKAPAP